MSLVELQQEGWLLSVHHIQNQAFHNQLRPYLLLPGGMKHPKPMNQLGEDGIAVLENGNGSSIRRVHFRVPHF